MTNTTETMNIVMTGMANIHVYSETLEYVGEDDISVVMKEDSCYMVTPTVNSCDMMRDENDNPLYLDVWVDLGVDVPIMEVPHIIENFEILCENEPHMHFVIEDSGINEE